MAQRQVAPSNEHIVRLLEALRADLAESKKQQDRIARDVQRLLEKEKA